MAETERKRISENLDKFLTDVERMKAIAESGDLSLSGYSEAVGALIRSAEILRAAKEGLEHYVYTVSYENQGNPPEANHVLYDRGKIAARVLLEMDRIAGMGNMEGLKNA